MTTPTRPACLGLVLAFLGAPEAAKLRSYIEALEARAALAQPEPVGATDEELFCLEDLRDAWNAQADPINSWDELGMDEIIWFAQQQALTRWGRPTPLPIPVSERLPGPGDCDAEGR